MGVTSITVRSPSALTARSLPSVSITAWRPPYPLFCVFSLVYLLLSGVLDGRCGRISQAVSAGLRPHSTSPVSMIRPAILNTVACSRFSGVFHPFPRLSFARLSLSTGETLKISPSFLTPLTGRSRVYGCRPNEVNASRRSPPASSPACSEAFSKFKFTFLALASPPSSNRRVLAIASLVFWSGCRLPRGVGCVCLPAPSFLQTNARRRWISPRHTTMAAAGNASGSSDGAFSGKPKIVFVLGGPGAGKGTQCELLMKHHNVVHISAGDCLREERQRPNSKDGELIQECIREGRIVPVEITLTLILKKMLAHGWARVFLIDGFPRNQDNLDGWLAFTRCDNLVMKLEQIKGTNPELTPQCDRVLTQLTAAEKTPPGGEEATAQQANGLDAEDSGVDVSFCLFLDCPEKAMEERLLERGKNSGRADDNAAAIQKRFRTYQQETMPIIKFFEARNKLKPVDAAQTVEQVWECVDALFKNL
ncbi:UMP-CMP kinase [Besnoitia besnoiti]|uniref:UMP-CMP kinase n=1 Tax=Besnoitia besnoiti TaxID=94643 RepID=A0A2A9M5G7_BESBE|nr:UMP-CMP kinase [Besnoitia besnoiti]PFH33189.1 UMP-CMP kinase [Besnoitia besnoiti]